MFATKLHFAVGLLLWLSKSTAAASASAFGLYVYGLNITGMPIFYMDSLAYVGESVPTGMTGASNLTFTKNNTSLYIASYVSSGDSVDITTDMMFYVNTSSETSTQAGFTTSSSSSLSMPGFIFDGSRLAWEDGDDTIDEAFWATETDMENVYQLMWNQEAESLEGGTPVVVKNVAPSTS